MLLVTRFKTRVQKITWVYICKVFEINHVNEYKMVDSKLRCEIVPITFNNYHLVEDFREKDRINNYKSKLENNELGFFTRHEDKMIGSIWATINRSEEPIVARTFIDLMPNEGLIHDIVVGEKFRGMSVGSYMVGRMAETLFKEYEVRRVIVDVNIKNRPSLRMMKKSGLRIAKIMFFVSVLGKRVSHVALKRYF